MVVADPISVAVIDDYEIVVRGFASLIRTVPSRLEVVELDADEPLTVPTDVALYDSFAQGEAHTEDLDRLLRSPLAAKVLMYTWNFDPWLIGQAQRRGLAGYLSKGLPAARLVAAIEEAFDQDRFVLEPGPGAGSVSSARPYPGRDLGLTEREAEVLALIARGHDNAEIARLLFLSPDGLKTRIRVAYRKIGARNRTAAMRWALTHGFLPGPTGG